MSHQVVWTKIIVETFVEIGNLTKFEEEILRTRASGWTIQQQALAFSVSVSTINRTIKKLKKKYDIAQKHNVLLPPRKKSAEELYMDTH